ncbi:MAG: hypothetical protein ACD_5C00166G0004 [uncultured bacterium]|nr:MAG: hypothetical protein ACD_5C00166G0004 [uncultured bacterium]
MQTRNQNTKFITHKTNKENRHIVGDFFVINQIFIFDDVRPSLRGKGEEKIRYLVYMNLN